MPSRRRRPADRSSRPAAFLTLYFEGPIRVDPLIFPRTVGPSRGLIRNDGALRALSTTPAPRGPLPQPANQVPVEHLACAYIGQSACQAPQRCESGAKG